jgi:hypothetical protein
MKSRELAIHKLFTLSTVSIAGETPRSPRHPLYPTFPGSGFTQEDAAREGIDGTNHP